MTLAKNGLVENWRLLHADDLGIGVQSRAERGLGSTAPNAPVLTSDNPAVKNALRLALKYGGVLFTGPPGTGKTFLAAETARLITDGDEARLWTTQFHASYGYEDFIFGYVPVDGGFASHSGPFLQACRDAHADRERRPHVIVIDELSRGDVGRIFGEALTYLERDKRERRFLLANGETISVPSNLIVLATMNPLDRGVDEVDAAFERRFAKVRMDPDPAALDEILTDNEVPESLKEQIIRWFKRVNAQAKTNPAASVGHAYFTGVTDEKSLNDLWEYQLQFLIERAFRLDQDNLEKISAAWHEMIPAPTPSAEAEEIMGDSAEHQVDDSAPESQ